MDGKLNSLLWEAAVHHVLSLAELNALGVSGDAAEYRANTGRLFRWYPGVYSLTPTLTVQGRWRAANLACRGPLWRRSAGVHQGLLSGQPPKIELAVDRHSAPDHDGLVVRRTVFEPWELIETDGILATIVARTLMDLCAGASDQRVSKLLKRAERLRIFDERPIRRVLRAHPHLPDAARLTRGLLRLEEPNIAKNELEQALFEICDGAGYQRPLVDIWLEGYEVDFYWPAYRLVVETDGKQDHFTHAAFEDDRDKGNDFVAMGYGFMRFTYRQVMYLSHQTPQRSGVSHNTPSGGKVSSAEYG